MIDRREITRPLVNANVSRSGRLADLPVDSKMRFSFGFQANMHFAHSLRECDFRSAFRLTCILLILCAIHLSIVSRIKFFNFFYYISKNLFRIENWWIFFSIFRQNAKSFHQEESFMKEKRGFSAGFSGTFMPSFILYSFLQFFNFSFVKFQFII